MFSWTRSIALSLLTAAPVVAQITPAEYAARRDSLAGRIGDGVVIAFGGRTPVTDRGPFYQLAAFNYLTGYEFADASLIIVVKNGKPTSTLFAARTPARLALYYGQRPDSAQTAKEYGLASRPVGDLGKVADSIANGKPTFYTVRDFAAADFAGNDSLTFGGQFAKALAAKHPGLTIKDAHPILDQLRARKSEAEMALLRKAGEISADGHKELMRRIEPGMHEYDLQGIIEMVFRRGGSERNGYGAIVGSGPNASELHYMKDRRAIEPGEVIVVDAAAEYRGYSADVTRTLPINGRYTKEQREIYQLVRDAQAAAERNSVTGKTIQAALDSSVVVRAKGLAALGLIESPTATYDCGTNQTCTQASLFTIHGITHGLGLEVHDPAQAYYGDHTFKVGDAFTIEPGIYITTKLLDLLPDTPKNRAFAQKVRPLVERYQNTGVRIEDSYILTKDGLEWISKVPRDLDEVEALTKRRPVP